MAKLVLSYHEVNSGRHISYAINHFCWMEQIFIKNQLSFSKRSFQNEIILLLTNHAGKNEIIAPQELIIAQVAKPRGQ